ncbi:MAG: hypothetical protein M5U20_11480 [Phycisphaerales bacterium]|nr:hypothetical protein [Phycisphaerales bacterium]
MNHTLTIAEAFLTISPTSTAGRWPGIDTQYVHLRLSLGRRGLVLTARILGQTGTWETTGARSVLDFERLANTRHPERSPATLLESKGFRPGRAA